MQWTRILVFVVFLNLLLIQGVSAYTVKEAEKNFWVNNHPSKYLKAVLRLEHIDSHQCLSCLVKETQKEWLRPSNLERWDLVDTPDEIKCRSHYFRLFEAMDLTQELKPTYKQWDYVVILGSIAQEFVVRTQCALRQKYSDRSPQFIILTGSRTTNESEKTYMKDHFQADNVNTELECMEIIAKKLIGISFNYKIISQETHSETIRATTEGTVKEWLLNHLNRPDEKTFRCLLVTSQPSGCYQLLVAYNVGIELRRSIEWDLVAASEERPKDSPVKVYLDNIARILFNLRKIFEQQNTDNCTRSAL